MALTARQQRFIDAYLVTGNATEAAKAAGYSARSAASIGQENLTKPEIASVIGQRQREAAARADVDAERIRRELAAVAFSDPRQVVTWGEDGVKLVPSDEISDEAAAGVAQVRVTSQSITVRQHDKLRALELLGKDLGMFRERLDVNVTLGEVFEEIRRRAQGGGCVRRLLLAGLVVVWLAWMAGLVRAAATPGKVTPAQAAAIILHARESRRLHIVKVECLPYVGRRFACVLTFDPPLRGHRCFAAPFVVRPRIEYDATLAKWCDQAGGGRTPPSS